MKNKHRYILYLLALSTCYWLNAKESAYYYYKGEKIFMDVDSSRLFIASNGKLTIDEIKNRLSVDDVKLEKQQHSYTKHTIIATDKATKSEQTPDVYISELTFSQKINPDQVSATIQQLQMGNDIIKGYPSYKVKNKRIETSNNFYVKLFKATDVNLLEAYAQKYAVQVMGYNKFMPLWYTLSCTKQTPYNAVELSTIFFESGLFNCSEPEFYYHLSKASNDQYYSDQWGLNNTGQYYGSTTGIDINADDVWQVTTGLSSIKVAIFDDGFEMDHPDLVNNVHGTGYDAQTGTSPSVVRGNHGTFCAGIVGAEQNNSIGISGVAPSTNIMSISMLLVGDSAEVPPDAQVIANGFNWAWQNGADVISNSWQIDNNRYPIPSSIIDNAISNALINGRDGKGTIVVFAAGNYEGNSGDRDDSISYPAASNPDILVVGAIRFTGIRKELLDDYPGQTWSSRYNSTLDVMAPGYYIYTTDRQGALGSNSAGDYILFNGTSAACPFVAGLAALILSRDSLLTGTEVRDIIEKTAQKIGGYSYQTVAVHPNGTWNEEMGYGLIDAYEAVVSVCARTSFTSQIVSGDTTVTGCKVNVQDVTVQNGAKLAIMADEVTEINGSFEVQVGATLEIQ